jgi:hypothetical protein
VNRLGRRARWSLVLAILLGVGLAAVSLIVLYPHYLVAKRRRDAFERHLRRKAMKYYMQESPPMPLTSRELADSPNDAESMVRMADRVAYECEQLPSPNPAQSWRRAFEVWALEPEPRDERPLDRLVELSRDAHLKDATRLELLYLIEEMKQPTFKAALDLPDDFWLEGKNADVLAELRELAPIDVDPRLEFWREGSIDARPPGALAEIVQELDGELVREDGRFKIKRPDYGVSAGAISLGPDEETNARFRAYLDPSWGRVDEWVQIEYRARNEKWFLLGRDGAKLGLVPDGMEPLKFFRALAALRGLTPPRKIAERVYEVAPVGSAAR